MIMHLSISSGLSCVWGVKPHVVEGVRCADTDPQHLKLSSYISWAALWTGRAWTPAAAAWWTGRARGVAPGTGGRWTTGTTSTRQVTFPSFLARSVDNYLGRVNNLF